MPGLKERTKAGTAGQIVQAAIEKEPVLRRLPNYRLIAADAFIGRLLRHSGIAVTDDPGATAQTGSASRATRPAAKTPAHRPGSQTPAAPAQAGVLPRGSRHGGHQRAAKRNLSRSGGSEEDLAASIAAKLT